MKNLPSATRIVLYVLVISLCVLVFLTYRGDQFKDVFDLFKTSVIAVISFFFGKSTQESMSSTPVQKTQSVLEQTQVDNSFELEK